MAYSDTEYRIRVYSDTEYGCIRILNTGYLTNDLFLDGFFFSFIFMYWLYHCWDVALSINYFIIYLKVHS